jgi:hypothetical protein
MKATIAIVITLVFGLLMAAPVFAQQSSDPRVQAQVYREIAKGKSGNFKGEVVSCDAAKNACTIKTTKGKTQTGNMTYAQYNGGFNAAKELQPGTKVSGQWQEVKGVIYATVIVED